MLNRSRSSCFPVMDRKRVIGKSTGRNSPEIQKYIRAVAMQYNRNTTPDGEAGNTRGNNAALASAGIIRQ